MYNPVKLLEAVADVSNLLEAKRLLFESGLLTEAELKDLAGLDKSLDYLDKEVDKALKYSQNLEKIFAEIEPKDIDVAHVGNFTAELFCNQGHLGGFFASSDPEFFKGIPPNITINSVFLDNASQEL